MIVENVGGAGGTLGAARVAKAEPDGYTLLLYHIGQATSGSLYRKLPYDPAAAFAAIGRVTDVPMTIVARADLPPNNAEELIEYIREQQGRADPGQCRPWLRLASVRHAVHGRVDVPLTTVPYKGTAPAMTDLLGGQVDLMCDQTTNTAGQIKAGKVKAYAVTTKDAAAVAVRPADPGRGRPAGLRDVGLARSVGAGRHAAGDDREADHRTRARARGPKVIERFADLGTVPVPAAEVTPSPCRARLLPRPKNGSRSSPPPAASPTRRQNAGGQPRTARRRLRATDPAPRRTGRSREEVGAHRAGEHVVAERIEFHDHDAVSRLLELAAGPERRAGARAEHPIASACVARSEQEVAGSQVDDAGKLDLHLGAGVADRVDPHDRVAAAVDEADLIGR